MLEKINFDEAKQSQLPAVEILINLGYEYISIEDCKKERNNNLSNFILHNIATKKLMEINSYEINDKEYKFSEKDISDAIDELENMPYEGLIATSQKIYNMIMPTSGGKTIKVSNSGKTTSKNFKFIDFKNPDNNSFHVTVEYTASGKRDIRPDIVCFVNGIPFAIIENKKTSVSNVEAINQMNRNQTPEYCPKLFTYAQLLVCTNKSDFKYGATGTLNKFYAKWKESILDKEKQEEEVLSIMQKEIDTNIYNKICNDLNGNTKNTIQYTSRLVSEQDKGIVFLFKPERLLDLTKNYVLFDAGVKKISRYQQFFAVHKILKRINQEEETKSGIIRRKGGLIWHTQGSGKSLTMVMFVKTLIEDPYINNPRIIIVTDRKDLDKQIKDTFKNCNLKKEVKQAKSGKDLLKMIKNKDLSVITTLVHKFETAHKNNINFIDYDKNIFVLVDEAHRTQSGIANLEMNRIIPNACYIGFTGTPLMKKERESWRKFGGYIDKYTIDDALEDKIILPLIYEGRYVDLIQNKEQIDRHVERMTRDLNDKQKRELQKFIDSKIIKNNPQRIAEVAFDIENHFSNNFKNSGLKAQIVAPSKYSAVLFQRFFEEKNKIKTAIIISDEHEDGDQEDIHKKIVIEYLNTIRKNGSVEKYEKDAIDSFKNKDEGIEIIIVVNKLLTGFDAPRNTILYLAKDLKDHSLLQAIARVNRLYENKKLPKTAGYIIDYSENAKNIKTAMKLFGNYDEDDVKGTLINVSEKIEELEQSYSLLNDIFKTIKNSSDDEEYLLFLQDEQIKENFYKKLNSFIKNLNECFVLQDFVHEFKHLDVYRKDLKKLMELRKSASLRYADEIDLSEYKQSLINILDKYVDSTGVELLTKQVNITDKKQFDEAIESLGSDKSRAAAIAAQTQKTINEKMETDPEFYERFSKKIKDILEKMKNGKISDLESLKQLKLFSQDIINKKDKELPNIILENKGADVFYRNLKNYFEKYNLKEDIYIDIIVNIFNIIKKEIIVDWFNNIDSKRKIKNYLDDYLYDIVYKEKNINISNNERTNIINTSLELAENNNKILF